jgi:hypothetical protein
MNTVVARWTCKGMIWNGTETCRRAVAALIAVVFGATLLVPQPVSAQVAPAPTKDTANPSAKTAPKADEGTRQNFADDTKDTKPKRTTASSVPPAPSKDPVNASQKPAKKSKKARKNASSAAPSPGKDTANPSAKTAPKADEGTGAHPSEKKSP